MTDQKRLRIAIDARYLSHGLVGGVHSYVRNLTTTLACQESPHSLVLWVDSKAPVDVPGLNGSVEFRVLPWRNMASSAMLDMRIGAVMKEDGADVVHFPGNYGFSPSDLPTVITLHDAINLLPLHEILRSHPKRPQQMLTMSYLWLMTRRAVRRDPFIVTVSNYSRREILERTGLDENRVRVVYRAPDRVFRVLDPEEHHPLRERLGLRPRVLLADAIKNGDCTLRSYRALPADVKSETSLVFFSRQPPSPAVQAAMDSGQCVFLHRPSRDDLVVLYNIADLFIFPSWYEGFGLPVTEAMACGTPVIGSDRGSLPEVIGDAGHILDAEDHEGIAAAVVDLLSDSAQLATLRCRALARADCFSPGIEARQTLDVYEDAVRDVA